uniref:SGNH hydrolase-type esterase domain-containing protein n=1 Tax=Myripristis murdjan TaxID=586833 RepID=A0A667WT91_9TELE
GAPPPPPGARRLLFSPSCSLSSHRPQPTAVPVPSPMRASDEVSIHSTHLLTASSLTSAHKLSSKLSVYKCNPEVERPEILVVGDSIIRFVKLPGAITYCLSGGKTADFIELIPALLDIHPSVLTVIAHTGTNDVMSRQSTKLHYELESLASTVESLGRRCVLSGPTPVFMRSSERFSRLFSLHSWLENFTMATGLGFISHFDSFWIRRDLFKHDVNTISSIPTVNSAKFCLLNVRSLANKSFICQDFI